MKTSDPQAAVEEFLSIPALEPEKGEWGFKGLKQAIKLEFKLELYDKASCTLMRCWANLTCLGSGTLY
jgi:COP9 signalosome complex subunit 2